MSDPERDPLHQCATSSDRDDSPPSPPTSPPVEPQAASPSPAGSGQVPPGQADQQQPTGILSTSVDCAASSSSTPVGATPSGFVNNIWAPPSNTASFSLPPTSGTSRPASQSGSQASTAPPTLPIQTTLAPATTDPNVLQGIPDNAALLALPQGQPQGTALTPFGGTTNPTGDPTQPNPTPPPTPTDVPAPAPDDDEDTFWTDLTPGAPIIRARRTWMAPLYMLQESVVVDTLAIYCIMPNCGLMFPSSGEHAEHLNIVHGVGRFMCHGCTETFQRSEALGCHVRHHHRALNGNWRCPECGKIYRTHNKLHTHIHRYHYKGMFKCYHPGCAFGPSTYRDDVYRHFYREHNTQATRQQFRRGNLDYA